MDLDKIIKEATTWTCRGCGTKYNIYGYGSERCPNCSRPIMMEDYDIPEEEARQKGNEKFKRDLRLQDLEKKRRYREDSPSKIIKERYSTNLEKVMKIAIKEALADKNKSQYVATDMGLRKRGPDTMITTCPECNYEYWIPAITQRNLHECPYCGSVNRRKGIEASKEALAYDDDFYNKAKADAYQEWINAISKAKFTRKSRSGTYSVYSTARVVSVPDYDYTEFKDNRDNIIELEGKVKVNDNGSIKEYECKGQLVLSTTQDKLGYRSSIENIETTPDDRSILYEFEEVLKKALSAMSYGWDKTVLITPNDWPTAREYPHGFEIKDKYKYRR